MATDREVYKSFQQGQLSALAPSPITDPVALVQAVNRQEFTIHVQDAATAGTAVTETVVVQLRRAARVIAVTVAAPIAVAADNTDYVTFTLAKRTGAGSATAIATADTRAASLNALAAFVPEALTITASAVRCAADDVLTIAVAKAGSGKAIVAATSYLTVTVTVEFE